MKVVAHMHDHVKMESLQKWKDCLLLYTCTYHTDTHDHSRRVGHTGITHQRWSMCQLIFVTALCKGFHSTQDRTKSSATTY